MALASVKATSCTALLPASRMWYPEMEMVFHWGTLSLQYAMMSVMTFRLGSGGKM